MKFQNLLFFLFAMMVFSCSPSSVTEEEALFENQGGNSENTKLVATDLEENLHNLVNEHRAEMGLKKLQFSNEAYPFAGEHNEYMIKKGKLSHDNFNDRAKGVAKKTGAGHVSENVAKDYTNEEALQGWLESKSHRKTIEGNYTHSTINIKEDDEGNLYFTQIFFRK
ncbi:CAP domain-containing protein [Allomuricauda sp. SCSIO 65647]|uniref:CAP domain-containing protein n=1 Tax=Allomuricauda sp. SCSIO 65647 TaxID=2908843 RepID=UPI001F1A7419|nr:CAP domain-containing protein [Muricauda sp. SCSIO 65647]UJH66036.1 CAP domain-containing protein [Muricauda sp. SCSIO 65647]